MKNGFGIMVENKKKLEYKGEWKDNAMHGKGILHDRANKKSYEVKSHEGKIISKKERNTAKV